MNKTQTIQSMIEENNKIIEEINKLDNRTKGMQKALATMLENEVKKWRKKKKS